MRHYPLNSPQAATRIVVLAVLADGNLCRSELAVLERLNAAQQLGLPLVEVHDVIQSVCEDLLGTVHQSWAHACRVDERTLAALMADVDEPELQRRVLRLCLAVVAADGLVADGEAVVLRAAIERWGLHRDALEAVDAL